VNVRAELTIWLNVLRKYLGGSYVKILQEYRSNRKGFKEYHGGSYAGILQGNCSIIQTCKLIWNKIKPSLGIKTKGNHQRNKNFLEKVFKNIKNGKNQ
jgi:hypothetical protein